MTSFSRPTRSALIERNKTDLNSRLRGADSRLRRNMVGGIATMHGGGMDGLYGDLDYIADQVMPDSADLDHLVRWAKFWGITPKGATLAADTATSGVSTPTTPIPINTVLQRGDGATFITTTAAVVGGGGTADIVIQAQAPGSAGNSDAGTILTLVNPIAGVSATFTIDGTTPTLGNDAETPEQLLARLEQRIQNPPTGGGPGDYARWALSQPGVTRAWEAPLWMGLGTVGVFFVYDNRVNPIPLAGDVTAMQAFLTSVAPAPTVYALAPIADPIAFSITISPTGNAAVQAAIEDELADYLFREADPLATVLKRSQYQDAIGLAEGLTDYAVTVPAGDIAPAIGYLPTLGAITWS